MKPEFPRADPAALAAFDPRTKACTMNCGPSNEDPRSPEERRFLCPDCETVESSKIDPTHTPAARSMWIVNFPDGDSYDLALNAARHMAEWTAIQAAQASCNDPHSSYCNAMRKRSAQYAWVARILEGDAAVRPAAESHLLRRVRSLKVLLGVDSPEVRGWAPVVQQEALRVVHEVIALLASGFSPPRDSDAAADDRATHLETLHLRSFYNVSSLTELVRAQAQQIENLQEQISPRKDEHRSDAQRWRLVKEFHPLLRLEHWDGHGWGSLYGEAADKLVDELILKAKP